MASVIQGFFPHGVQSARRIAPPPASRVPGQPLPGAVRQMMEGLFRTSFAAVRVYVGPQPGAIGTTSFTQGENVYFAPGQYVPHVDAGRRRLAYELAHVVQQRTGRVRNPFGSGVALVNDPRLEAEARQFAERAGLAPVAQLKKSHAQTFVRVNNLPIPAVTFASVSAFVNDDTRSTAAEIEARRGLRASWNRKMPRMMRIPEPESLRYNFAPNFAPGFDASGYESEADRDMNIADAIAAHGQTITVDRSGDRAPATYPALGFQEAARIARQIVRRDEIAEHLPLGMRIGPHSFEVMTPHGNDAYAVPLARNEAGNLAWAGRMAEFSWQQIAGRLDDLAPDQATRLQIRERIFGYFRGMAAKDITASEAEAIAAMMCDLVRGNAAHREFINAAAEAPPAATFGQIFGGPAPHYAPAAEHGRSLVSARAAAIRAEKEKAEEMKD